MGRYALGTGTVCNNSSLLYIWYKLYYINIIWIYLAISNHFLKNNQTKTIKHKKRTSSSINQTTAYLFNLVTLAVILVVGRVHCVHSFNPQFGLDQAVFNHNIAQYMNDLRYSLLAKASLRDQAPQTVTVAPRRLALISRSYTKPSGWQEILFK